ncbi:hypothetical protein H113_03338 [Trichophyton rubrum MR1459]|uniref:Uncharacterized protein n=1 Tax=Trichophyton rubrum (strain ATCC MYA-4607 / CBS 118892) TaxID=559305 RepID=A0A080WMT0_TRIRC|nr:uncharacterized protein TERG_12353 [Trichophyton rubrum CBS 118892]EZF96444.1 hypothetical protein H113_03338 [Trichophyton rubrum MR1459]KFL62127.1 hypothetical protein TERG_12353 [Trichophyton rubrum CBS 118892]
MATASSASAQQQAFAPVLAALQTMQSSVSRQEKTHAHEFLEKFQKSVEPSPCPSPRILHR